MITLEIEAVSKNGKGIMSGGEWYNADKKMDKNFDGLRKGQTLQADANEKWIKNFTIIETGSQSPSQSPSQSHSKSAGNPSGPARNSVDTSIARCTSVKAVLGSQSIADMTKDMSDSESFSIINQSIKVYTNYILTGQFADEVPF